MDGVETDLLCTAIAKQKGHTVMTKRAAKPGDALIRSIPLFGDISDQARAELAAAATLRQFAARAVLFNEGSKPDHLYIVLKGSAELFSEHDERYCTLAVACSRKPLALCAVLTGHNALSARALEACELIVVPATLVIELFGRDPAFARAVVDELASE